MELWNSWEMKRSEYGGKGGKPRAKRISVMEYTWICHLIREKIIAVFKLSFSE